jgi:Fe2+-dicitrate sensor, membrane component
MEESYSNLIIRYLQGNSSPDETNRFYEWIRADAENKKLFFGIKAIYDAAAGSKQTMDIEESWERLLNKKKQKQTRVYVLSRRILAYAAAILLVIVSGTTYLLLKTNDSTELLSSRYIGGNGLEADVVVLPDGTRISLGANTVFHCEKNYGRSARTVYLEGEAYFDVIKQNDKPFVVKCGGQNIEVLGTKFNVMAYPDDSVFTTTLLEGSIRLTVEDLSKSVILSPDQQLSYNRNKGVLKINSVDAQQVTAWTSGYYFFSEQRLEDILHRLSLVYGVEFIINSEKLKNPVFTGTFYRGQNIKDIMEVINMSIPIKYEVNDHQIIISES